MPFRAVTEKQNMKLYTMTGWLAVLCLSAGMVVAQETNDTEKLKEQLKQIQETFDKQQQEMRERFERMLREQQAQIDSLKKQIEASQTAAVATVAPTNAAPAVPATQTADVEELKTQVEGLTSASKRTSVNQFNPGIGFAVDSIFSYTSKGEKTAGLDRPGGFDANLRTAELNLEATVDPFAKAYGVIAASADAATGEAALGVEEASVITTSLPWNLTAQGGRFFGDFGRFSYVHDHDLPFVFRPLVLDRYIGGESRTDGAQVNYLFPTAHYVSLTLGLGNGFGADAGPTPINGYRSLGGVNYWGHLSTYFDLTSDLNLETGVSGLADERAQGILTDPAQRDRFIGASDITLRYQPLGSSIHRGLTWGTEVLVNSARFETGPGQLDRENSAGLYSYVETKLTREVKAGFLFDWMEDPALRSAQTYRYSPYLTWNPSEFQTFRLQYSHTQPNAATGIRPSDAVYLQWTAIIGRHVHGFKQR